MPTSSTQSLPWWSSQVRLEDLPGDDAREARRCNDRKQARLKARIARDELNTQSVRGPNNPRHRPELIYIRFLNAIEAGQFTVDQIITLHDLIVAGVTTARASAGNNSLQVIQADLAVHQTAYRLVYAGTTPWGSGHTSQYRLALSKRPAKSAA